MQTFSSVTPNGRNSQTELDALRELLEEKLAKAQATEPVKKVVTYRTDIAALPCWMLVQRVIAERGEQASAIFATKLTTELARRGKARVKLSRAARNGHGNGAIAG